MRRIRSKVKAAVLPRAMVFGRFVIMALALLIYASLLWILTHVTPHSP